MKISDNLTKHEVLIEQYLRSIMEISVQLSSYIHTKGAFYTNLKAGERKKK